MKSTLLFFIALVAPQLSLAAITSTFDCTDSTGASIHWEAQPVFLDETGEVAKEQLYRNRMRVTFGKEDIEFYPDRVTMGRVGQGKIHATSKDGQYITAIALKKIGEEGEGDTVVYSGTVELKLKTSNGKILKRAKGTKLVCRNYGEA